MEGKPPIPKRHAWNVCLALGFLALLARAIENAPSNGILRHDLQTHALMGWVDVLTCVALAITLVICIVCCETDRQNPRDTPLGRAWAPTLAQAFASITACISLATGPAQTCGATALNADIGGIGVLVGIYFPAMLAILSLAAGHWHTCEAGTKEIGVVLLANLAYLTFNLLKATADISRLSFADAIVALLSIDATCTALSATMSNKDALAARKYVGLCAVGQAIASIIVVIAVAQLEVYWHGQRGAECCARHIWWATWTSCDMPGPNIWMYIVLSIITRGYDVVAAFRLAPELDQLKKEAQRKKADIQTDFELKVSNCLSRYMHHIPALLANFTSLLSMFHHMGVEDSSKWSDWGQSATLITCVFGTCHWLYVCAPLLELVDVAAGNTDQKSRWSAVARVWLNVTCVRWWSADMMRRACRDMIPRAIPDPQKLTPEYLGEQLLMAAVQGDLTGVRQALIDGAHIDWHIDWKESRVSSSSMVHRQFYIASYTWTIRLAARLGQEDVVRTLLDHYRETNSVNGYTMTHKPGTTMDRYESAKSFKYDTRNARDWSNYKLETAFDCAAKRNDLSLFELLAPSRVNPVYPTNRNAPETGGGDYFYAHTASKAIQENDIQRLMTLWLTDKLTHSPNEWRKLMREGFTGRHAHCAKLLVSMHRVNGWPDLALQNLPLLSHACAWYDPDFVQDLCSLLDYPNNMDAVSALDSAASRVRLDNVDVLIRNGAPLTNRRDNGQTTLHNVIARVTSPTSERLALASKLIAAGADVNAVNRCGLPPLFTAMVGRAATGHSHAVDLLVRNGAVPLTDRQLRLFDDVTFAAEFGLGQQHGRLLKDERLTGKETTVARRRSLNDAYRCADRRQLLSSRQYDSPPGSGLGPFQATPRARHNAMGLHSFFPMADARVQRGG
ncbi:hypothetical protein LTR81_010454 [Elasticomyces elasticus]